VTTGERDKRSPVQDDPGEEDGDQTTQSLIGSLKVSPRTPQTRNRPIEKRSQV